MTITPKSTYSVYLCVQSPRVGGMQLVPYKHVPTYLEPPTTYQRSSTVLICTPVRLTPSHHDHANGIKGV